MVASSCLTVYNPATFADLSSSHASSCFKSCPLCLATSHLFCKTQLRCHPLQEDLWTWPSRLSTNGCRYCPGVRIQGLCVCFSPQNGFLRAESILFLQSQPPPPAPPQPPPLTPPYVAQSRCPEPSLAE